MSISSEITRLQNAKNDLKTSINNKLIDNKITNETIDDYADKVDEIVLPSNKIADGIVDNTKMKKGGPILCYNPEFIIGSNHNEIVLSKLDETHILTYYDSGNAKELRVYELSTTLGDKTVVATKTITDNDFVINNFLKTVENPVYNDGDYYYVQCCQKDSSYQGILLRYIIVTDLENIYLIKNNDAGELFQIDNETFFWFFSDGSVLYYGFFNINYDGENTSFSFTEPSPITDPMAAGMIYPFVVAKNRIIIPYNNNTEIKYVLYDTSNNTLTELCNTVVQLTYNLSSILPSFGKIYVFEIGQSDGEETSYILTVTDDGFVKTSNPDFNGEINFCFDFTTDEFFTVLEYYDEDTDDYVPNMMVYSFNGYNKTLLQDNLERYITSAKLYNDTLKKINNIIYFACQYPGFGDYPYVVVFLNTPKVVPLGYITNVNDSSYPYYNTCLGVAAADGVEDDIIEFYAVYYL